MANRRTVVLAEAWCRQSSIKIHALGYRLETLGKKRLAFEARDGTIRIMPEEQRLSLVERLREVLSAGHLILESEVRISSDCRRPEDDDTWSS